MNETLVLEVRAGAGGGEAALFAERLVAMYLRLAGRQGWSAEVLARQEGPAGGVREASLAIAGAAALRCLRGESGGHRVQRVPPTERRGRVHSSLATVAVLPEPAAGAVALREADLEVDVMRAGGPGGQHQNKTESAVRLTHRPSGLVVVCRDERSQHKNRERALRLLRARLLERERTQAAAARSAERRGQVGSGDRSERIRTYNFPQDRVTDHRLGLTVRGVERVLGGDLGPLLGAE